VPGERGQQAVAVEAPRIARELRAGRRLARVGEERLDPGGRAEDQVARRPAARHAERVPGTGRDRERVAGAGHDRAHRAVLLDAEGQLAVDDVEALAPRIEMRAGPAAGRAGEFEERERTRGLVAAGEPAHDDGAEHEVVRAVARGRVGDGVGHGADAARRSA
jgi:hypothetical protein